MSAAKEEKKIRTQSAADEQAKQERNRRRGMIIGAVVVAVVAIAAIIINSSLFATTLTAVKVGSTNYTAAELNVFYRNTYNNFYSQYASYAQAFGMDVSSLINPDTVYEQTLDNMKEITALYDDATKNGYTLSAEDQASVTEQMDSLASYAAMYGYSTDAYITAYYGKGVTRQTVEKVLTRTITAQSWAESVSDGMTYTQEQLDSYYDEHADEFDYIEYWYYLVSTSNEKYGDIEGDEEKMNAARADAEEIRAAVTDSDSFAEAVEAWSEGAAPSEQYVQGSNLSSDYSAWLLDSARKSGDTTVADGSSGVYVLLFTARDGNEYNLRSMRHILIETESTEDADGNYVYTDEAGEAAKARIEEIAAEYETDPTEEHFAELANEYSDDSGSNTNGGLYENIRRRQMVTNINDFLFNERHTVGDTGVLFGESGAYQGWHLVYYAGEGQRCRDYLSENAQRSADYESYLENLTASYEVSTGAGLNYASVS